MQCGTPSPQVSPQTSPKNSLKDSSLSLNSNPVCRFCNAALKPGKKFCTGCGKKTPTSSPALGPSPPAKLPGGRHLPDEFSLSSMKRQMKEAREMEEKAKQDNWKGNNGKFVDPFADNNRSYKEEQNRRLGRTGIHYDTGAKTDWTNKGR